MSSDNKQIDWILFLPLLSSMKSLPSQSRGFRAAWLFMYLTRSMFGMPFFAHALQLERRAVYVAPLNMTHSKQERNQNQ